jgi:hypothetical protein
VTTFRHLTNYRQHSPLQLVQFIQNTLWQGGCKGCLTKGINIELAQVRRGLCAAAGELAPLLWARQQVHLLGGITGENK